MLQRQKQQRASLSALGHSEDQQTAGSGRAATSPQRSVIKQVTGSPGGVLQESKAALYFQRWRTEHLNETINVSAAAAALPLTVVTHCLMIRNVYFLISALGRLDCGLMSSITVGQDFIAQWTCLSSDIVLQLHL